MKIDGMNQEQSDMYMAGRQAHAEGKSKDSCPFQMRKQCWWLAGWIDADIESGKTIWGHHGNSN